MLLRLHEETLLVKNRIYVEDLELIAYMYVPKHPLSPLLAFSATMLAV